MTMQFSHKRALLMFSGGQDSTICLGWALDRFDFVETVGFYYGQRHDVELLAREKIRQELPNLNADWAKKLGPDHILDIEVLSHIGDTAMTAELDIKVDKSGFPNTFVPGRNLAFYVLSSALAYRRGIGSLVGGMCETDYSGYPDCREETLQAQAKAINLGMDTKFEFHTPLMHITKAGSWALAEQLGGEEFVAFVREKSHTCYKGDHVTLHEWGYGCANCPACDLRARGWESYQQNVQASS